ncbi:hypothetical protein SBI67_21910, partial [Mycolicibacterium sp. 120266]|uniref:hypothetical protein n=1 Tax=Mycolicibacterium sp. 120266 TaxID=3090601 RepID=UPI00299EED6C
EESRDDLQSLGYDTPVPLIRSDSYTTLLDATVGFDRSTDPQYLPSADNDTNYSYRDAAVWTLDGDTWTSTSDGLTRTPGAQQIGDITYSHGLWLAVGEDNSGDPRNMDGSIWKSSNGRKWEKVILAKISGVPGFQAMKGVIEDGESLVIVGTEVPVPDTDVPNSLYSARNAVWKLNFEPRRGIRDDSFASFG